MNAKLVITLVLLTTTLLAFSQEKIIFIKDSVTHEPVPFAAIQFADKKGGIYSNEIGQAVLPDSIRRILISQIAYHTREVEIEPAPSPITILLTPALNQLPEVLVSNMPSKRKKIGLLKPKGSFGVISTPNTNFALFIPFDPAWKQQPAITSIIAYLNSINGNEKYPVIKSSIRFDLRLPDTKGQPSNVSLLKEPIVHPSEKRYHGCETVHLPRPVPFPSKGVFIVVDCIIPAQIIVEQRQIISPTICCTGSSTSEQTWSRTITNDFTWRKMNWHDPAWAGIIKSFYGENGVINLRAGLEIAY